MATTADDVWRLLGELIEAQKETERRLQETERLLKEQAQETDRRFQENDRQLQETKTLIQAISEENRQVNRQLSKQLGELGGTWGRFVEDLVAPACERLFVERGIPVDQVSQRVRRRHQGETLEIDVLVVNQGHVLAVEVKSRLSVDDINEFVADLERFRDFFPEYAQMQIYGAVAGIGIDSGADRYAYRQGLFVLAQAGDDVVILNNDRFEPKRW